MTLFIPSDAATTPCDGENDRRVADKCVSIKLSDYRSWFEARWDCIQGGGGLLSIEDAPTMTSVTNYIGCYEHEFWIGGTNVKWEWAPGKRSNKLVLYVSQTRVVLIFS